MKLESAKLMCTERVPMFHMKKEILMNRLAALVVVMMLAMAISCSHANSGPSEQIVKEQVSQCLNSMRPATWANFPDYFEVQDVVVKDKMVKQDEATIMVDFTVRLKNDYGSHDQMMAFGNLVRQKGKANQILSDSLTVKFNKFEKGWQITCPSM